MMVAPLAASSRISFFNISALMGSKPEKGSSKMRNEGSWMTVTMNWIFCCMPLESSSAFLFHQDSISNFLNQNLSRRLASALERPRSWAK